MIRGFEHRTRWTRVCLAIVLVAAAIGLGGAAQAAGGGTSKGSAAPKTTSVKRLCDAPDKPGEMACFAESRTDVASRMGFAPLLTPSGYGPADLQAAYTLPSATAGAGQTVAIVDAFDNPNVESDLAIYRAQYGLPACTSANGCFRKVNQDGQPGPLPTGTNAGWAGEMALDLDMASAICPQCNLLLIETNSNVDSDLLPAVSTAADLGAKFISLSFGGPEFADQTTFDPHLNHPGVAITVSTGDNGYGVSFPSSSPYVTAVGGTSLVRTQNTRGWFETAWSDAGSGCSVVEAKPAVQIDPGCDHRTVADVSAVADPQTGVAVYNTFQDDGWNVFGGTSAAAPIIAAAYALAGPPAAQTYPNTYPYQTPSGLNDVVGGSNGSCGGTYLCTAQIGFDGPTGLGTPSGVAAFAPSGPHGVITGTVTDAATGKPIVGARVVAATAAAVTSATGQYSLGLVAGTYQVTASAFGYATATTGNVVVRTNATTATNIALASVPHASVSGHIRDGSGHGWPLYARITVDGVPGGAVFTDPATGRYQLNLPSNNTYTMHVTAIYPGYQVTKETVPLATADVTHDIAVPVDATSCTAAGYAPRVTGLQESFDATTVPAGWSVVNDDTGGGWAFTDNGNRGNLTGGSGGFAIVDSDYLGAGHRQDSQLRTPVLDFSTLTSPSVGFDSDFRSFTGSFAEVDLSLDGGQTWQLLLQNSASARGPLPVTLPIPQAAGVATVQIRLRYVGEFSYWWEVDNLFAGQRSCDPVHGGLVLGQVVDGNTRGGVDGARVHSADVTTEGATASPTPDDPNLGDGFYWFFSSLTGQHSYTASRGGYVSATKTLAVAPDAATRADFTLAAGQIAVAAAVTKTVKMGGQGTASFTVKNTGTVSATVSIGEHDDGFGILTRSGTGAPLNRIDGSFSKHRTPDKTSAKAAAPTTAQPYAPPWTDIATYPMSIMDNAAAAGNGKIYSVGGTDGNTTTAAGFAYDPSTGSWTPIASMLTARQRPVAAFVQGKLYVAGGWASSGAPEPSLEIYNPVTDSWTTGARMPTGLAASGVAVLGGRIYVVGGCADVVCGFRNVQAYDPVRNSWSKVADYPLATSWISCGGLQAQVYCAGGANDTSDTTRAFGYNPATDEWTPIADLPIALWGSGYVATTDALVISGGVTNSSSTVTNQGYAYNPASKTWTAIANANNALYRGGSACGFYKIGGAEVGGFNASARAEVLPGLDQCGTPADVAWLSVTPASVTLAPGRSTTVSVTFTASSAAVTQPGDYAAALTFVTNTPYQIPPTSVTMTVTPPSTWGKITGTVTGLGCAGTAALSGAVVQIDGRTAHYTLLTDKSGVFALWLDKRNSPVTIIVAKDTWQPQVRTVKIKAGQTVTVNWRLTPIRAC